MAKNIKLKPCPFCGQKLELDDFGNWYHIDNGCILSWIDSMYGAIVLINDPDSKEAWNRRAE